MRKTFAVSFVLVLMIFFVGCNSIQEKNNTSLNENVTTEIQDTKEFADVDLQLIHQTLLEETSHFKKYGTHEYSSFYYEIYSHSGRLLDYGYATWKTEFEEDEDFASIICRSGGPIFSVRYYDLLGERVSRIFSRPLQRSENLVAYFENSDGEILLIVQDIFDPSVYYNEFQTDWSEEDILFYNFLAEFAENNTKLEISYQTNSGEYSTLCFDLY